MEFIEYTTQDGDRWDLIAFNHYGNAAKIEPIASANLHVPLNTELPAGVTLRVPVLELTEIDTTLLPPWKQ